MAFKFLTDIGRAGKGQSVTRKITDGIRYIHDVLLMAAQEGLDVAILCGSLRAPVRDQLFRKVTREQGSAVSFADTLRAVLEVKPGVTVRILIWNEIQAGLVSSSMRELIDSACAPRSPFPGKLDVRISGTTRGWKNVCHFIAAFPSPECGAGAADPRWFLRIEEPHPLPRDLEAVPDVERASIPAVVLFQGNAREEGERALKIFNPLFEAAGRRKRHVEIAELVGAGEKRSRAVENGLSV